MVPPASHGIPRAPRYSGSCSLTCVFGYVALTLSGRPSHAVLLTLIIAKCSPQPRKYFYSRFGLLPLSLATTRGISVDFFSSPYLDVSVQAVPLLYLFDSVQDTWT